MKKRRVVISICSVFLSFIVFMACASTSKEKHNLSDNIVSNSFFEAPQTDENDCYIFLRLYDPVYKNPLYIANLLKTGITLTEVNSFSASHVAMSFHLDDCFLGLTSLTNPQLNFEICSKETSNEYMIQCDKQKSTAYIYSIKVTPEEREKAIAIIQNNMDVQYDSALNFVMADKSVKRSLKRTPEEKKLEEFFRTGKDIEELNSIENQNENKKFVCSGFAGYVLYNSVQSVRDFFNENTLDYHYLPVTDFGSIPGVERLFECSWAEYEHTAENFVQEHREFQPYLETHRIAKSMK
ncbi:MAG: hypothetical protein K6A43_00325 [Treponema sp.]|nr:hypothetical protein [Treponema sp.]